MWSRCWAHPLKHCASVQTEEDFQSYLGSALVWKAGSGELVKHPWWGTCLWTGNLCFGGAGWRKTSKSLCNSPWTGAFTSPATLVTNHTSLCLTVTARLEKPCHPDPASGARGFSELLFAVFWEFLKKTLSFCGWFHKLGEKQLLVLHSSDFPEKCKVSAGHHDDRFYRFSPFLHIQQAAKPNSELQCISLCLTSPWDNPFASVLWKLTE